MPQRDAYVEINRLLLVLPCSGRAVEQRLTTQRSVQGGSKKRRALWQARVRVCFLSFVVVLSPYLRLRSMLVFVSVRVAVWPVVHTPLRSHLRRCVWCCSVGMFPPKNELNTAHSGLVAHTQTRKEEQEKMDTRLNHAPRKNTDSCSHYLDTKQSTLQC